MPKRFLNNIFQSELIRNSSILISGNVIGMGATFLVMPVLSRLYSDSDFGIFALMMSLTGILSFVATGKYEEAFVLTKDKDETSALLGFVSRLLIAISIILFLILLFFRETCLGFFNMEALEAYWWQIPIFTLLLGAFNILSNLANKTKQYKSIATANLLLNILNSLSKVAAYFLIPNAGGLLAGQINGQLLACLAFVKLKGYIRKAFYSGKQQMIEIARKYKDFPLYNMPRGALNSFSMNLPFLILTGIFGEARLGLFFIGFNITFRPISLVSNSIYQVLYEKVAGLKQENMKISHIINSLWKSTTLYLSPCFLIAFIIAPWLFKFVFGAEWEESGTYFRYILPWMFGILITTPIGFLPLLFNRQRKAMIIEVSYFICRIASLLIGIYAEDFNLCILLFSLTGLLFMAINFFWYTSLIRKYEHHLE